MSDVINVEDTKYYVLEFDAGGYLRKNAYRVLQMLREELLSTSTAYTDVVFVSHGWNVRREEEDGRIDLPHRVVPSLFKEKPEAVRPLFVAISWPSFFTTLFDRGSGDGLAALKNFLSEVREAVEMGEDTVASRSLPVGDADKPDAIIAVDNVEKSIEAFLAEENSSQDTGEFPPDTMSPELRENVAQLVNEISMQSARVDSMPVSPLDDEERYCSEVTADMVEKCYQHVAADVDADSEKPSVEDTNVDVTANAAAFAVSIPRIVRTAKRAWRLLFAIQDLLFGTYERRASIVGGRGVHTVIGELMRHARPSVRFSGYGHSLGAHVVQAAAIGMDRSYLSRKVHTLMIAQGACESRSLAQGGAYRPLVSQLLPVAGPILATVNSKDPALIAYDVFLKSPYGRVGFGMVRPFRKKEVVVYGRTTENWRNIENIRMNSKTCYTLDCGTQGIIEGHGDVEAVEVSQLFWKAVQVEIPEKEYEPTDPALLPRNYWSDPKVRSEKKGRNNNGRGFFRCTIV